MGPRIDTEIDPKTNTGTAVDPDLEEEVFPDLDPGHGKEDPYHGREEAKRNVTREIKRTLKSIRIGTESIEKGQKGEMCCQDSAFGQNQ